MGFFGLSNESEAEIKKRKEIEERLLKEEEKREKEIAKKQAKEQYEKEIKAGNKIGQLMLRDKLGEPVYYAEGIDASLWVYDDFIIIDRNKSKLFNAFNHTVKFIPYTSLTTLQFKNSGLLEANIEFGVAGYDAAIKKNTDLDNENLFSFEPREGRSNSAEIYFFILGKMRDINKKIFNDNKV